MDCIVGSLYYGAVLYSTFYLSALLMPTVFVFLLLRISKEVSKFKGYDSEEKRELGNHIKENIVDFQKRVGQVSYYCLKLTIRCWFLQFLLLVLSTWGIYYDVTTEFIYLYLKYAIVTCFFIYTLKICLDIVLPSWAVACELRSSIKFFNNISDEDLDEMIGMAKKDEFISLDSKISQKMREIKP